jgi:hypothetical protein
MKKIIISLFICGCCQVKPIPDSKIEQQPPELFIAPKTNVITTQGVYTSGDFIEIWHSHKKYSLLQDEISKFRPLNSSIE